MRKNVGNWDRWVRGIGAVGLFACAVAAPLPQAARGPIFGGMGMYMLFTALVGTCLGYRLMGRSTCPVGER